MGKSLKVSPAKRTDSTDHLLTDQDRKQIARLGKLLKSDAASDLKTRHLVGKVLNKRVGPPSERKSYGGAVVKLYGEGLGISPSDLNRIGWFAALFPNLSALRTQHPEIDTWTKFKTALPSLKPPKGGKAREPGKDESRPAFGGVARSLTHLAAKFDGLGNRPSRVEQAKIVDALRVLAKAASSRLKIRVDVAVGVKDIKPVAITTARGAARA
jgi:hypothetical protein